MNPMTRTRRQVVLESAWAMAGMASASPLSHAMSLDRPRWERKPAAAAGTLRIGDDLVLNRLGFGTGRLNGVNFVGMPPDSRGARALLRRAVELGCMLIDTSEVSGPNGTERLIYDALSPYPPGLVVTTKGGVIRVGNTQIPHGRPDELRAACEQSLRSLRLERIDLYQLHIADPKVPIEESVGELARLQQQGKIRHIGLSDVSVEELRRSLKVAKIVAIERRYNFWDRSADDILAECERLKMTFLPWGTFTPSGPPPPSPATVRESASFGSMPEKSEPTVPADTRTAALKGLADRRGVTPNQVALAWLLARSPVILPIPGTTDPAHLEENVAAAHIRLSHRDMAELG